jgi:hypothetical protein
VASCTVRGLVRGGRSASSAHGEGYYGLHLWLEDVLQPVGLKLSAPSARPCPWPPNVWEGRGECPDCGRFVSMRVVRPGLLACDRCGCEWTDPA